MFGRKRQTADPNPVVTAAPAVTSPSAAQPVNADSELIAVITAAIAALESSASVFANGFVVRKISRITGGTTAWSNAGLNESINSRRF